MSRSSPLVLPSYTPAAPLPSYSSDLTCGERRLAHTPQPRESPPPTSVFLKESGKQTIVLEEQEEGASIPTYGRQSTICGSIFIEEPESVLEVKVQLEATLETAISQVEGLYGRTIKLIEVSHSLWSHTPSPPETCPHRLSFAFVLPATFRDENSDNDLPVPPSFHEHFDNAPMLFVGASYQLHFIFTRIRHHTLHALSKTKNITIPFNYIPRTWANRAIPRLPTPCFFSSVKTSPEEWVEAQDFLKTHPSVRIDPVSCHMFLPASRIYSMKDTIPVHVQLAGKSSALKQLFQQPLLNRVKSADSHHFVTPFHKRSSEDSLATSAISEPFVHVCLMRQISVVVNGSSCWRNKVLGEATLSAMPPEMSSCCPVSSSACMEDHVDWEGELRCSDEVFAGSFTAANVQVKDFIVLSLPPPSRTSPLLEPLEIRVPITLVTDSFLQE